MRAVVRLLSGFATPAMRRAAAGAIEDFKGLPGRFSDPQRRAEPWAFLHNVGGGPFGAVGAHLLATLRTHADLTAQDRVLDIGCGTGRVAAHLAPLLAEGGGRYLGFDVSKVAISECRRRYRRWPHMAFHHLDVWNGDYNASGRVAETDTVFPAADGSFDLAFASSVFTHMRRPAVSRYLSETARVLAPGGRIAFTAYALEPGRTTSEACPFQPLDDASSVLDPRCPESGIGHDRAVLDAMVGEAGLTLTTFHRGAWAPDADYDGFQDLFVAVKV